MVMIFLLERVRPAEFPEFRNELQGFRISMFHSQALPGQVCNSYTPVNFLHASKAP